jgi:hypothetical protein
MRIRCLSTVRSKTKKGPFFETLCQNKVISNATRWRKTFKGQQSLTMCFEIRGGKQIPKYSNTTAFFNLNRRQGHPANCHHHIIIIFIIADEKLLLDTRILKRITGFNSVGHVPSAVPGNTSRQSDLCRTRAQCHSR